LEVEVLSLSLKPRHSVRAKISAVGAYVPPRLLTNADLEKMVETNDEWIVSRTGICERHIVEPGTPTSALAVEAAKVCLANRGIDASEIDAIIVATVTPDMLFPATACIVQEKLGATKAWGFDLSAACSGYLYAMQMGAKLVESGAQKKVLVIGADVMSSIIDYTDRSTCILFGDGAGATLIEPCEEGEVGVVDFLHEVDGSGASALNMPGGGSLHPATHATIDAKQHYVHQDGGSVYKVAVRKMAELAEGVLQRNEITGAEIDCFIPHQANRRIIEATADRLGMPLERVIINIDRYGNTTAATIPLAMDTAIKEGKLKKGSLVLLASFGGGYTIGSTLLRWEF
jgi:3-oxoacyl-[acyl-carrier-protein] synthase-3